MGLEFTDDEAVTTFDSVADDKMSYHPGDYVAVHSDPVWRARSNFVFRVPIEGEGEERHWEQLWWQRLSDTRFVLCCIPFFAYGLSLGDEVVVDDNGRIVAISKPSGQWTYRVWFGDVASDRRMAALEHITREGPIMEQSSENLLALSASAVQSRQLADVLARLESEGFLRYECGWLGLR
jgi:hypothetical protein